MKTNLQFKDIKTWQLAAVLAVFLLVAAASLRQNNLRMGELRQAVLTADKANQGLQDSLQALEQHVFAHMNSSMKQPLELVHSYDRAVKKAQAKIQAATDNSVYRKAEAACDFPNVLLSVRAECIQDYIKKNSPAGASPQELELPPKELYAYQYRAPAWSPDVAGWSIVASLGLVVTVGARLVGDRLARLRLNQRGDL